MNLWLGVGGKGDSGEKLVRRGGRGGESTGGNFTW